MGRVGVPADTNSMAVLLNKERIIRGGGGGVKDDDRRTTKQRDAAFLAWLRENGARFDRVDWPSTTEWGTRGAVARRDIVAGVCTTTAAVTFSAVHVLSLQDPRLSRLAYSLRNCRRKCSPCDSPVQCSSGAVAQ